MVWKKFKWKNRVFFTIALIVQGDISCTYFVHVSICVGPYLYCNFIMLKSIDLSVCPSIHPSIHLSFIHLSIHPFSIPLIHASIHLPTYVVTLWYWNQLIFLYVHQFILIHPLINQSIHSFINPFIHQSIHPFIH